MAKWEWKLWYWGGDHSVILSIHTTLKSYPSMSTSLTFYLSWDSRSDNSKRCDNSEQYNDKPSFQRTKDEACCLPPDREAMYSRWNMYFFGHGQCRNLLWLCIFIMKVSFFCCYCSTGGWEEGGKEKKIHAHSLGKKLKLKNKGCWREIWNYTWRVIKLCIPFDPAIPLLVSQGDQRKRTRTYMF